MGSAVIDHKRTRRVQLDAPTRDWLAEEHLINWCDDCRAFHLDIDNIGDEREPASWERLQRLIAKAKSK